MKPEPISNCWHTSVQHIISLDLMRNLSARAKILSLQHFAEKQRTTSSLRAVFFQNNSFLVGSIMETGRQKQWYSKGLTLSYQYALNIFRNALFLQTTSKHFTS